MGDRHRRREASQFEGLQGRQHRRGIPWPHGANAASVLEVGAHETAWETSVTVGTTDATQRSSPAFLSTRLGYWSCAVSAAAGQVSRGSGEGQKGRKELCTGTDNRGGERGGATTWPRLLRGAIGRTGTWYVNLSKSGFRTPLRAVRKLLSFTK